MCVALMEFMYVFKRLKKKIGGKNYRLSVAQILPPGK